ncbi:PREDICTED: uncharacterized protein LOC101637853 [Condylura cristata]|uniref:uncharacterized protein LOC101637853 n=1 Tax=Condylura cristata TaxID=143302 RepID=UPI000334301F|nr:PREDICTED: uncharacterized protein LOC101637853 [Condylura cristata]
MAASEAVSEKSEYPILEITRQNFFQEAKALIAQHNEKINEGKTHGTSINVFRNKHQKTKSARFLPLEIKKETFDIIQELQTAHKNLYFLKEPKDLSQKEHIEESSRKISFKEPCIFNIKGKGKESVDQVVKEQVKLGEILTDIETVSKKMEKGKYHHPLKPRITPFNCYYTTLTPKAPVVVYHSHNFGLTFLAQFAIHQDLSHATSEGEGVKSVPSKMEKIDNKVKRIGPHIDIFQVFRENSKLHINKKTVRLVITMQAYVRGWLERKRFQRIMTKALYHGPNLKAVINMYCKLIHRVKHRLGLWRTKQVIDLPELEEWMDRKKYYEIMFAKREEWQGIERSELLNYFNDCGHFPTQEKIDDVYQLVYSENLQKFPDIITKPKAIEMLFTLYPPQGAHVHNNTKRLKSTWLRPIVNGEEGYRYIDWLFSPQHSKKYITIFGVLPLLIDCLIGHSCFLSARSPLVAGLLTRFLPSVSIFSVASSPVSPSTWAWEPPATFSVTTWQCLLVKCTSSASCYPEPGWLLHNETSQSHHGQPPDPILHTTVGCSLFIRLQNRRARNRAPRIPPPCSCSGPLHQSNSDSLRVEKVLLSSHSLPDHLVHVLSSSVSGFLDPQNALHSVLSCSLPSGTFPLENIVFVLF